MMCDNETTANEVVKSNKSGVGFAPMTNSDCITAQNEKNETQKSRLHLISIVHWQTSVFTMQINPIDGKFECAFCQ